MALEDEAEEEVCRALQKISDLPRPKMRHAMLVRCLKNIAHLLNLEITIIQPPEPKKETQDD